MYLSIAVASSMYMQRVSGFAVQAKLGVSFRVCSGSINTLPISPVKRFILSRISGLLALCLFISNSKY